MVKVLLIGCGFMGSTHVECYRELARHDVVVSAVCDIQVDRAKAAAAKFKCKYYTDADKAIKESGADAVDICLPTYLHTHYAVLAMEEGKSVFLEKPACLTFEECEKILNVQKKTGARVMVGQVVRMSDEYKYIADAIKENAFGKVLSAEFKRVSTRPLWTWENWLGDPEKGGTMTLDFHVHDIDFVRSVFGTPDSITSSSVRDKDGIISQIYTNFIYGDVIVRIDGCWEEAKDYPFEASFRVSFEKATVEYKNNALTVYPLEGGKYFPEFTEDEEYNADLGAYYKELKYFAKRIEDGGKIEICDLSDALESVKLVIKETEIAGGAVK